jgi:hypothetical protein
MGNLPVLNLSITDTCLILRHPSCAYMGASARIRPEPAPFSFWFVVQMHLCRPFRVQILDRPLEAIRGVEGADSETAATGLLCYQ